MYDTPTPMQYDIAVDLTAVAAEGTILGPPGARGIVRLALLNLSAAVAADTTEPVLSLGTTVGGSEIVPFTVADGTAIGMTQPDDDIWEDRRIDADETIYVNVTTAASDAGTAAGAGTLTVVVDWDVPQPRPYKSS